LGKPIKYWSVAVSHRQRGRLTRVDKWSEAQGRHVSRPDEEMSCRCDDCAEEDIHRRQNSQGEGGKKQGQSKTVFKQ